MESIFEETPSNSEQPMPFSRFKREEFSQRLRRALELTHSYERPDHRRVLQNREITPAAVLILFAYLKSEFSGELTQGPSVLFIRRAEDLETHKGQMAFPGGLCEERDLENPMTTALREAYEEVGVQQQQVQIEGVLPKLVTATSYSIVPVVGTISVPLEEVVLQLDARETAEAPWIPLSTLLSPGVYRKESLTVESVEYPIDVYQVGTYRIWGATASITKNLLERIINVES